MRRLSRWRTLALGAWIATGSLAPANAQPAGAPEADVASVLGPPAGQRPTDAMAVTEASEIAAKLRCPVCQGVSIADSPSGMATKMRRQVRDLVAAGYTEEQVMNYFEHSYGEFVRLEPPMRGLNWMLWAMPSMVLLAGVVFVYMRARSPQPSALPVSSPSPAGEAPVTPGDGGRSEASPKSCMDPELAKYLERIRRDSGSAS